MNMIKCDERNNYDLEYIVSLMIDFEFFLFYKNKKL